MILTSLPEPPDVEKVARSRRTAFSRGVKRGAVWFDLSTNSQSLVKRLSAAFAEKGAHMLDAPVSGGPQGAASRKLAIWVGGDKSAFDAHKAVLDADRVDGAGVGLHGLARSAAAMPSGQAASTTCPATPSSAHWLRPSRWG